ncbi:hypothetical protein [Nocardioides aurantiacus]|uniref:hypothetical protein n=1 Tax=Nocardioides aurantiacus TaxID=86796 RepID=UPI0011CD3BD6|nr:hypothetical protein [Nocardioides aurantiacus]
MDDTTRAPELRRSASAAAAAVLVVGMAGGVLLMLAELVAAAPLAAAGVALVVVSCVGAAGLTVRDSRRSGRSVPRAFGDSVRAFGRWFVFLA